MSGKSDGGRDWIQGSVMGVRRARRGFVEAAQALLAERRVIVLAAIAALICLLLADLLGASDEGKTLAAVSGAIAGKALDILDKRFKWGERWLAAIAGVLALFKFPRVRARLLTIERPVRPTPIRLSRTATWTATVGGTTVGAVVALVVSWVFTGEHDRGAASTGDAAHVFPTAEQAIAAQLVRSTVQYVGPCDGRRMEPPDRRIDAFARCGWVLGTAVLSTATSARAGELIHLVPTLALERTSRSCARIETDGRASAVSPTAPTFDSHCRDSARHASRGRSRGSKSNAENATCSPFAIGVAAKCSAPRNERSQERRKPR
jgi:hypothetical protein